jgi:hypothetical protein
VERRKKYGTPPRRQGAVARHSSSMPMTGYDRDAELVRPEPGPWWRRYLVLAAFIVAMLADCMIDGLKRNTRN